MDELSSCEIRIYHSQQLCHSSVTSCNAMGDGGIRISSDRMVQRYYNYYRNEERVDVKFAEKSVI